MEAKGIRQYSPGRLRALATAFQDFAQTLPRLVIPRVLTPINFARSGVLPDHVHERAQRCLAFGRDLDRPPSALVTQYGLYGTAAALELLSLAPEREQYATSRVDSLSPEARTWAEAYLRLWNFLAFAVLDLSSNEHSKFWLQNRILLRNSNILRALGSIREGLLTVADPAKLEKLECWPELQQDLAAMLGDAGLNRVGSEVLRHLIGARVAYSALPADFPLRLESSPSLGEPCLFRFASETQSLPATWNQWIFLWSSALIGVIGAYSAEIINEDEVAAICTASQVTRLRTLLEDPSKGVEDRVRLFSLYALSHLAPDIPGTLIPNRLRLSADERRWLEREIAITVRRILRNDVSLIDAHIPYEVLFDGATHHLHHDDYFVIPVVPISISLLAQYRAHWLFRPRIKAILNTWMAATKQDLNWDVLPYQLGEYNGTVNSLYYHEAALNVAEALNKRAGRGWLLAVIGWAVTRWQSIALFSSAGLVFGLAAYLQTQGKPSEALVGAGITLILSWTARFAYDIAKKRIG